MNFAVLADHRIKLKESEKKDKYRDLDREFKKLRSMKVTIIKIVIGAFGTVTKGLLKGREVERRPSKILHYQKRSEYWEESWRLKKACYLSNSSERPSADADVKNSQRATITKKQKWEEKQLYGSFKRQTDEILLEKTWTRRGKGNLIRETESLLIAERNNAILDEVEFNITGPPRDDWTPKSSASATTPRRKKWSR